MTPVLNAAKGKGNEDPMLVAKRFFTHPQDSDWQNKLVIEWARENRKTIERGSSLTELHHLHEQNEKAALARAKRMGEQGEAAWAYIEQHYETLTGEKKQVQP